MNENNIPNEESKIKRCPICNDILVEHPLIPGSDGTGGYGLFCESCDGGKHDTVRSIRKDA